MKEISLKTKVLSALGLLLATVFWGINYVAQQNGSQYMDPFTFNTTRMIIGAFVVLPIILMKNYKETKKFSFLKVKRTKEKLFEVGLYAVLF